MSGQPLTIKKEKAKAKPARNDPPIDVPASAPIVPATLVASIGAPALSKEDVLEVVGQVVRDSLQPMLERLIPDIVARALSAEYVKLISERVYELAKADADGMNRDTATMLSEVQEALIQMSLATESSAMQAAQRVATTSAAAPQPKPPGTGKELFKHSYDPVRDKEALGAETAAAVAEFWKTAGKGGGADWLAKNPNKRDTADFITKEAEFVWGRLPKDQQAEWSKRAKALKTAPPPAANAPE